MKRLAAILLLLAAPAWSATYWVGLTAPGGNRVPASFANSGADSTQPRPFAWVNYGTTDSPAGPVAGDIVRMMPGYYPAATFAPKNCGSSGGGYLTLVGAKGGEDAWNYELGGDVQLDSSRAGNVKGLCEYVSVRGVAMGDLKVYYTGAAARGSRNEATSVHDSISYCVVKGSANLQTVSDVTLYRNTIGTGDANDHFAVGYPNIVWAWHDDPCHCDDGIAGNGNDCTLARCGNPYLQWTYHQALPDNSADSAAWSTRIVIKENTFNLATAGPTNAFQIYWMKSSTYQQNRHVLYAVQNASDVHLNTWYDVQDTDIRDNYWFCSDSTTVSSTERYGLNVRDNQVANRWVRDTLEQSPLSRRPIKFFQQTSGAHAGTNHNNLHDSWVVKVGGSMGYQSNSKGDIHRFNTYYTTAATDQSFSYSLASSAAADSITFTHNTVVSNGNYALNYGTYPLTNSRITQNIFAVTNASTCNGIVGYFKASPGFVDSNLVWSSDPTDSAKAIALNFAPADSGGGGCATAQVRNWKYANDAHSKWGSPQFTDSTWSGFNGIPTGGSVAVSATYWADGYVGAKSATTADTRAPVVAVTTPKEADPTYPKFGSMDITWSATDDIGVSSVTLEYSKPLSYPTTWTTIATGQAAADTYHWSYPVIGQRYVYIRVTAVDATGNSSYAVVRTPTYCSPCLEDTQNDPNLFPE